MGLLYGGGWFGVGHSDGLIRRLWVHLEGGRSGWKAGGGGGEEWMEGGRKEGEQVSTPAALTSHFKHIVVG